LQVPAAGQYSLCWGHDPVDEGGANILVGSVVIAGPLTATYVCTLGIACRVTLNGVQLGPTNALSIATGSGCSPLNSTDEAAMSVTEGSSRFATWVGVVNPAEAAAAGRVYAFGTPVAGLVGSAYSLCWAFAPQAAADFVVPVDVNFTLHGPYAGSFGCTLGEPCTPVLAGVGLTNTSRVAVFTEQCGSGQIVFAEGLNNPSDIAHAFARR
jgi:hypothetical protein